MAVRSDRRVVGGIILIVVGVGLLALQLLEGLGGSSWLLLVGALSFWSATSFAGPTVS